MCDKLGGEEEEQGASTLGGVQAECGQTDNPVLGKSVYTECQFGQDHLWIPFSVRYCEPVILKKSVKHLKQSI